MISSRNLLVFVAVAAIATFPSSALADRVFETITLNGGVAWTPTVADASVGENGDDVTVSPHAGLNVVMTITLTDESSWGSSRWEIVTSGASCCEDFNPDHGPPGTNLEHSFFVDTTGVVPGTYDLHLIAFGAEFSEPPCSLGDFSNTFTLPGAMTICPDLDHDGICDDEDDDRDGDGEPNDTDNCPDTPNPYQEDVDNDGLGDVCDDDRDGDGVPNGTDNCPDAPNPDQADADTDGIGNVCDDDRDGDDEPNDSDNCPEVANPGQEDTDQDGIGDACDEDTDGDDVPDGPDNCPNVRNPDQADADGDGLGDLCDPDRDGDGVSNSDDNCPATFNPNQADGDANGWGDACDSLLAIVGCPEGYVVPATSDQGTAFVFKIPESDNGFGKVDVVVEPKSGTEFPIGRTTVTVTASDATGKTVACRFDVVVTPPEEGSPGQATPGGSLPISLIQPLFPAFPFPICGIELCGTSFTTLPVLVLGMVGMKVRLRRPRRRND